MSKTKKIIYIFLLIIFTESLFAKDYKYKVLDLNKVYSYKIKGDQNLLISTKINNEIVSIQDYDYPLFKINGSLYYFCFLDNKYFYIPFDNLIPFECDNLIPNIYINHRDNKWIPSYYLDILQKKDRELIRKYYPEVVERFGEPHEYSNGWYEYNPQELIITNCCIDFGFGHIYVDNIELIPNGFKITIQKSFSLYNKFKNKPEILIFKFDGDYLNVYYDDNKFLEQFIRVKEDDFVKIEKFIQIPNLYFLPKFYGNDPNALEQFNKDNTVDLEKFTWPRHADGSCDYDGSKKAATVQTTKPKPTTIVAQNKIMTVNENLKLRSGEATTTQVLTVMSAGTKVKILELGKEETIDGINSNWVKVEVISGRDRDGKNIKKKTTGWCYGGYLE